ncbi:ferredoxin [Actinoplanes xinjiangensis]|uniref:Ferredoxin n=1 Tax=Actinoplanes xinjiangensis TaxID=512350 RepID=A0A316EUP5_9ACTN|nr:ferredoxin [Actinoplanes xinjiangensis]PWK36041.1 ferredoxin [Actinoplanes xinjiangensis]GIF42960.1 hypothetical protein Axi01nite_72710 [Actinoplanes xinjiangensis]
MNVTVDRDKCCGAGLCVLQAPEVFGQDEDRIVMLLQPQPAEHHRDAVAEAVKVCPMQVIELSEPEPSSSVLSESTQRGSA